MAEELTPSVRPDTPPHHPTHNVHFSPSTIQSIVSTTFPRLQHLNIDQLPSGKSFNNRIYFLDVDQEKSVVLGEDNTNAEDRIQRQKLVLKVSGQFFGPDKIQNEVSALLLLEKYCPDVPVPRLTAWSEAGITICRPDRGTLVELAHPVDTDSRGRGWILMTRRPGRLLTLNDLNGPHSASLMRELAQYMAQWRLNLPEADRVGNLRLLEDSIADQSLDIYATSANGSNLVVEGLLLCHNVPPGSIKRSIDYYRMKCEAQLEILETEKIFSSKRNEISPVIREFIRSTFPNLSLFPSERPDKIVFTHYDLSPRNILVSETSFPSISGLLDFEFAGFFPEEEEFTNNAISNAGDWPESAYRFFLLELESLGVKTPLCGIDGRMWHEACKLVEIVGNIAPWYLREGGVKGQDLENELSQAAEQVMKGIQELDADHHVGNKIFGRVLDRRLSAGRKQ